MRINIFKVQSNIDDLKIRLEDIISGKIVPLPGSEEICRLEIERLESEKNFVIQIIPGCLTAVFIHDDNWNLQLAQFC